LWNGDSEPSTAAFVYDGSGDFITALFSWQFFFAGRLRPLEKQSASVLRMLAHVDGTDRSSGRGRLAIELNTNLFRPTCIVCIILRYITEVEQANDAFVGVILRNKPTLRAKTRVHADKNENGRKQLHGQYIGRSSAIWHWIKSGVPNARQLEPNHDRAEDDRRTQACGLTGLRDFLLSCRPFGRLADYALGVLLFVLTDRCGDSAGVEVVRFADGLADSVQLLNDGIAPLHRELPDGSSSGVQIIGGVSPAERQITSIVPRIVAFAMCLQFQVTRYSIWWAAAMPM